MLLLLRCSLYAYSVLRCMSVCLYGCLSACMSQKRRVRNFHSQRWFYWVSKGCIYLVLRFSSISVSLCFVTAMSLSVLHLYHCMTYCFRVIVSRPTLLSLVGPARYCSYYLLHVNVMFSEHIKFDFTWLTDHVCISRPHLRIGSTAMQHKSINLWLLSLF